MRRSLKWLGAVTLAVAAAASHAEDRTLLNSSYDIARELFAAYNPLFAEHWKQEHNENVEIKQSHGGSSKQAQAILQGLRADVVTYNQVTDVQMLHDKGKLIPADWQKAFPNNSSPYYSTTAFLVRKGNPKGIRNWDDLVKGDVKMVFPNPKTSGNGRYTYLAAWGFASKLYNGDEAKTREFVRNFLAHVAVFDTGGRGATTTFIERGIGDVLISFESEVNNIRKEYGQDDYEVVVPAQSILAEFPVAVVEKNAERNGNAELAKDYLNYLYSEPAQRLLTTFNYRVHNAKVVEETAAQFPQVELFDVDTQFGGWDKVNKEHFASGGILDQLQAR
ncbi:thiosulfate ABC transporter substrate-binding protein CysP [Pokkaliibacter sp. MBI-7]|uniref:thiosulfate ABC transporter substrate-binding protein CysP n=1 Tax=Pokkaliibacter sp. MBI-7 TaxID=3040600 RepID=UPI002448DDE1|nr:thiosulfate ABC transporter substrate-binding protein CysP [Pokkaliibacter sp. MBI-7]MDH2432565.1 thiosulfate ABC transporter substrate-binding protein CysP [Pokkaliibacter sp. MBI-7]